MSVASFVTDGPVLLAAPVAAAAGLISFLSPCVLPLVPGYLSYVAGLSGQDLAAATPAPGPPPAGRGVVTAVATRPSPVRVRGRVALGAVLFVLGFSAVFVSYGAVFGGLGRTLAAHQRGVDQVLGVVTIMLGLAFAGAFAKIPLANREVRVHRPPAPGLAGAPLLGVLFGVGWTPCVGPSLGAVNGLALQSATAGRGAFLSFAYCLGLGVPFVLVGLAFRRAVGAVALARRHARALMVAGGALLVVVGVLEVTGGWDTLVAHLREVAPGFSTGPL